MFSSRSSNELNEEIFEEYNSNNDERVPVQKKSVDY